MPVLTPQQRSNCNKLNAQMDEVQKVIEWMQQMGAYSEPMQKAAAELARRQKWCKEFAENAVIADDAISHKYGA